MHSEELQKIIGQFDRPALERNGTFGIFEYGGGADESYIRANKDGLLLFALELLKAAKNIDEISVITRGSIIPLPTKDWVDDTGDTLIHYVEPASANQKETVLKYKTSIAEKLTTVGFTLISILLVASIVVGFIKIIDWVF